MARARRAANAPPVASARPVLREKSNNTVQLRSQHVYEDDGDTHGLIKNKRTRARKAQSSPKKNDDEFCMTGAIAEGDAILEHGTSSSQDAVTQDSQDSAERDFSPPKATKPLRRPPRLMRKPIQAVDPSNVLQGLRQRMMETARQEVGKQETPPRTFTQPSHIGEEARRTLSDIDTSPTPSPDARQPRHRLSVRAPGSVLRVPSTPGVDLSTFALKNFKRRPRQGSMLQLVQHRTVSARTSAVHASEHDDSSGFDLGAASDEEAFQPEAECTPLAGSNHMKRGRESDFSNSSALDRLQAKKRKSAENMTGSARAERRLVDADSLSSPAADMPASGGVQVRNSIEAVEMSQMAADPSQESSIVPSTEQAAEDRQTVLDGTMADPASSSPLINDPVKKSMDRNTIVRLDTQSPTTRPRRKRTNPLASSTADLRALLPRRRTRARPAAPKTIYDLSSDNDGELDGRNEEDDELAISGVRTAKHKAAPRNKQKKAAQKARKAPPTPARSNAAKKHGRTPITYSRSKALHQENESYEASELVDGSTFHEDDDELPAAKAKSKELEDAKKRFADIDDFEMEFESVSVDSSQTWR